MAISVDPSTPVIASTRYGIVHLALALLPLLVIYYATMLPNFAEKGTDALQLQSLESVDQGSSVQPGVASQFIASSTRVPGEQKGGSARSVTDDGSAATQQPSLANSDKLRPLFTSQGIPQLDCQGSSEQVGLSITGWNAKSSAPAQGGCEAERPRSDTEVNYSVRFNSTYVFYRNTTVDGFTCQYCNNREQRLTFLQQPLPKQVNNLHGNRRAIVFVNNTARSRAFFMCLVPKNSCTSWKRLAIKVTGKFYMMPQPEVHKSVHLYDLAAANSSSIRRLVADKDIPLVFIARNPYIRLLSGYLDKHAQEGSSLQTYTGRNKRLQKYLLKYSTETFQEFVKRLYIQHRIVTRLEEFSSEFAFGFNHHFAPQARFCGFDQGLVYDYVLKLEHINEWYDGLINELGLTEAVSSGWPSEKNCFFSSPQTKCDGPQVVVNQYGGVTYISPDISPEHVTAATTKLKEYYTPKLIKWVDEIYSDDFKMFNYTRWDGYGDPILN